MSDAERRGQQMREGAEAEEGAQVTVCPFRLVGIKGKIARVDHGGVAPATIECLREDCQVWDGERERCSLNSIAAHLWDIVKK